MKKTIAATCAFAMVISHAYADQSVYIDQVSGDSLTLTIVQQFGDGNEIGQPLAASPYLSIEGNSQTLDILQQGAANKIYGAIQGDSMSFDIDQVGDNNEIDAMISSGGNSTYILQFTGGTNTLDFDMGQTTSSEYTIASYVILGSSNDFTTVIDADGAEQDLNITGDGSTYTITQEGYGSSLEGHYLKIMSVGSYNDVKITQDTTLARGYVDIDVNGDNMVVNITQSD